MADWTHHGGDSRAIGEREDFYGQGGTCDEQRAPEEILYIGEETHHLRAVEATRCSAQHESPLVTTVLYHCITMLRTVKLLIKEIHLVFSQQILIPLVIGSRAA